MTNRIVVLPDLAILVADGEQAALDAWRATSGVPELRGKVLVLRGEWEVVDARRLPETSAAVGHLREIINRETAKAAVGSSIGDQPLPPVTSNTNAIAGESQPRRGVR